jgi:Icc-related predicted phosphoesterase
MIDQDVRLLLLSDSHGQPLGPVLQTLITQGPQDQALIQALLTTGDQAESDPLTGAKSEPGNTAASKILIHAGDLTRWGSRKGLRKFADELSNYKQLHKIVIAGNHDFCFQKHPEECRRILSDAGIIYLEDEAIELYGIKFYGIPWTPQFGNWAFMGKEDFLMHKWARVPMGTDVLISHGPPRGILDLTQDGERAGGISHRYVVRSIRPKLNVFGHIHEAYGCERHLGTDYINACLVNFQYEMVNQPIIYDLEGKCAL